MAAECCLLLQYADVDFLFATARGLAGMIALLPTSVQQCPNTLYILKFFVGGIMRVGKASSALHVSVVPTAACNARKVTNGALGSHVAKSRSGDKIALQHVQFTRAVHVYRLIESS